MYTIPCSKKDVQNEKYSPFLSSQKHAFKNPLRRVFDYPFDF